MSKSYYVRRGRRMQGPFTGTQLRQFAANRQTKPTDEISASQAGPWTQAGKVPELFPAADNRPLVASQVEPPAPYEEPPPPAPQAQVVYVQAPPQQPPMQQNVQVVVHDRGSATIATASLACGIIAWILFCLPPFAWAAAGLGIMLGLLGMVLSLFKRGRGFITSAVGISLSLMAVVVPLIVAGGILGVIPEAQRVAAEAAQQARQKANDEILDLAQQTSSSNPMVAPRILELAEVAVQEEWSVERFKRELAVVVSDD